MASEETVQPADATCFLCGETLSRRGLTRHLKGCRDKHPSNAAVAPERVLQILADGRWTKDHYLHVEAPADLTFGELDAFLRTIWLECCGHLSGFRFKEPTSPRSLPTGTGLGALRSSASGLTEPDEDATMAETLGS